MALRQLRTVRSVPPSARKYDSNNGVHVKEKVYDIPQPSFQRAKLIPDIGIKVLVRSRVEVPVQGSLTIYSLRPNGLTMTRHIKILHSACWLDRVDTQIKCRSEGRGVGGESSLFIKIPDKILATFGYIQNGSQLLFDVALVQMEVKIIITARVPVGGLRLYGFKGRPHWRAYDMLVAAGKFQKSGSVMITTYAVGILFFV
ncbi:hypothetical protein DFS33DRAFT_1278829 [Desarmillaria ectypa]|nr:hypothetical protein DFS33DRAFT_1278829 [Desarmillaria ectypa]